ncbi:MAG: hypothetical protein HC923_11490 [Myxococcales bacterium]|nr:hypothetical protein [Myxococcales bacterium]
MTSYTELKSRVSRRLELEVDHRAPVDRATSLLPGGPRIGKCVHELLETVDLDAVRAASSAASLANAAPEWLTRTLARHAVEPDLAAPLVELVYDALTVPMSVGSSRFRLIDREPLGREIEFLVRLSERSRSIRVRGFIDAMFELEGELWILDYKSDILSEYTEDSVQDHVEQHYRLQADLYAAAVERWVAPMSRVGGVVFSFLRSTDPAAARGSCHAMSWSPQTPSTRC